MPLIKKKFGRGSGTASRAALALHRNDSPTTPRQGFLPDYCVAAGIATPAAQGPQPNVADAAGERVKSLTKSNRKLKQQLQVAQARIVVLQRKLRQLRNLHDKRRQRESPKERAVLRILERMHRLERRGSENKKAFRALQNEVILVCVGLFLLVVVSVLFLNR